MTRPVVSSIAVFRLSAACLFLLLLPGCCCWWGDSLPNARVETLTRERGRTSFDGGGLVFKERYSISCEVRRHTWYPIRTVIIDQRTNNAPVAYAFVGEKRGYVFEMQPAGIDEWLVAEKGKWGGDPRSYVLAMPAN